MLNLRIRAGLHHRHTILEHYLFRAREGSMLMCLGLGERDRLRIRACWLNKPPDAQR